ncbi:SET domain-containing protein [Phytophthora infestans]|uniref:SET domain-containing protein n=1 Tax=Phytophthora infestans TaxID=4787 RepID=A0A8S9USZ0_PHYIN|nr:SET domain-containing protein [Phytophthora infestans]
MLLDFRLSCLSIISKSAKEVGKSVIVEEEDGATWGSPEIIVIASSSESDEEGAVGDHSSATQRKQPPSRLYTRPKKNLPPPRRPNYVIHEVRVKRAPPKVSSRTESSPSAIATISTSCMSRFAGTSAPCPDIDYASPSEVAFVASPWPPRCCVWEELCANRPRESNNVDVKQEPTTGKYALVANVAHERGEVLGEYLGRLHYVETDRAKRQRSDGYMLTLRTRTDGTRSRNVGIDAYLLGGRMRFANHACDASAEGFEFANGARHTVVVVTTGPIASGCEVTVNYGSDLCFECRCKYTKCIHTSIQHEEDP